jgi:hypothetical protein
LTIYCRKKGDRHDKDTFIPNLHHTTPRKNKKGAAIQLIASTLYPEPQLKILNLLKWHSIENPLIMLIIY